MSPNEMNCANPKCERRADQNYCCIACLWADMAVSAEESFLGRGRTTSRHSTTCNKRERDRVNSKA